MREQSKWYFRKILIYFNLYFFVVAPPFSPSFIPFHSIIEVRVLLLYYFHSFSRIVCMLACLCADIGTKCDKQASKRNWATKLLHSYMYVYKDMRCKSKSTHQARCSLPNERKWNLLQSFWIDFIPFHSIYSSFYRGIFRLNCRTFDRDVCAFLCHCKFNSDDINDIHTYVHIHTYSLWYGMVRF